MTYPDPTTTDTTLVTAKATPVPEELVTQSGQPVRGFLLEVGSLTFPIYGDAAQGWSIMRRDIADGTPFRYDTFDELLFALLNFSVVSSGQA
jgi:bifunctional DNase/RNase